jgi:hypothetical protein
MPYYKFDESDIYYSRIKARPKKQFFIYNSTIFLDNQSQITGAFTSRVPWQETGFVSINEINVDRAPSQLVYPFIVKNGTLASFRSISTASFDLDYGYGDTITGSYPISASISRELFLETSTTRDTGSNKILALKNTLNYYTPVSRHYEYSSSLQNKAFQAVNMINIPSIFYGSSVDKGSVDLRFYLTGTLIGRLRDENKNGELIQVGPYGSTGSGSVAGVILYNEGLLLLTGSWSLEDNGLDYTNTNTATKSSWLYYAVGAQDGIPAETNTALSRLSASYSLEFDGTNYVPVVTMLAHAPRGQLNYSNNPTYLDLSAGSKFVFHSSSMSYAENSAQKIKNTVSSSYTFPTGTYKPQTFISKVGVYDENKNLIAIAKVATPVKKTEDRDLTFKLKLDF